MTDMTLLTLEDLRERRGEIMRLMQQYGAYNVRVFGSVARGEARADSDVDFLISFPSNKSMFELVGLWLDLQELLGRDVSLLTEHDDMREHLRKNVMRDAIPL